MNKKTLSSTISVVMFMMAITTIVAIGRAHNRSKSREEGEVIEEKEKNEAFDRYNPEIMDSPVVQDPTKAPTAEDVSKDVEKDLIKEQEDGPDELKEVSYTQLEDEDASSTEKENEEDEETRHVESHVPLEDEDASSTEKQDEVPEEAEDARHMEKQEEVSGENEEDTDPQDDGDPTRIELQIPRYVPKLYQGKTSRGLIPSAQNPSRPL